MARLIDADAQCKTDGRRLIDADALKRDMFDSERPYHGNIRTTYANVYATIDAAPTIEAEPVRHGYWIAQDEGRTRYMCSECKSKNHGGYEKYCPNCGAKMDGDET